MKRFTSVLLSAVVTFFATARAAHSETGPPPIRSVGARAVGSERTNHEADRSVRNELKKFRSDQVESMLGGNPNLMLSWYADDVRLMPEYQKTIMGKTNAASYHAAFSARYDVREYRREATEMLDLGSRVLELGGFTMKLVLKSTGREHQLVGKYLDIWHKLDTGGLSLVTAAWNYNHQVEIADALKFPEVAAEHSALRARVPARDRISFELAALNRLLEVTVAQHDAVVWSQFYANDAILLHSFNAPLVGKKAVDEFIEDHVKHLPFFEKLDIRNDQIDQREGYVIEYASHVASWRNGDSSGVSTGKNIRIWRREPDGALKIFRAITAYD